MDVRNIVFTLLSFSYRFWHFPMTSYLGEISPGGRLQRVPLSALFFALASLSRPEGFALFLLTLAHKTFYHWQDKGWEKRDWIWVSIFFITFIPFQLGRVYYYDNLLPNTFYAKTVRPFYYRLWRGQRYVRWYFERHGSIFLFLLPLLFLFKRSQSFFVTYLIVITASYLGIVAVEGGDWMAMFRFLVPILPFIFLLIQEGFYELVQFFWSFESTHRNIRFHKVFELTCKGTALVIFLTLPLTNLKFSVANHNKGSVKIETEGLTRAHIPLGKWLHKYANPSDLLVVSDAGAIPYFSNLPTIDLGGLTDAYIANLAYRSGRLYTSSINDKEKEEIRNYIMNKKPEWIVYVVTSKEGNKFNLAKGQLKGWPDLYRDARFTQGYEYVRFYTHFETDENQGYYLLLHKKKEKQ